MNCFALLFLYYYDYLTPLSLSFRSMKKMPLFFRKQLQFFCVCWKLLCASFLFILLAFLLSLFIYLSYYELLNYILKIWNTVLESVLLEMAIWMLVGEKKRKYNNHPWKHLGRIFEWIHESFKFNGNFCWN